MGPQDRPVAVCIDASLLVDLLLYVSDVPALGRLWEEWAGSGTRLMAPNTLRIEVASGIRRQLFTRAITRQEAFAAFESLMSADIEVIPAEELLPRAWALSDLFNLRAPYDMLYLALAEREGVDLWTTDRRLARTVGRQFPNVKAVKV